MKKLIFSIAALLTLNMFSVSCSEDKSDILDEEDINIPLEPTGSTETVNKPKAMWIDAHANFTRFADKEAITTYMEKIKDVGLNMIYLDIKPGIGYALYNSDILPKLTKWGNETVNRDWDYFDFFLQEAERLDIDVIASISAMGYGSTAYKEGPIFDDNTWDGKTQKKMNKNNPNDLIDIRTETSVDAAMLNPCLSDVQQFVISVCEEIFTKYPRSKYPKLKGLSLDYLRWYGADYGMSDETIAAFEAYSGKTVNSRNDIITATGGIGSLYADWIEFRTQTITNLLNSIKNHIKRIDSSLEVHLWASADWASRYTVGQNWASSEYTPTSSAIYTSNYSKTGFAQDLDVFVLGAYSEYVWKSENPNSVWTVENFVTTYNQWITDACTVYGSIPAYVYDNTKMSDAIYLCLKNTDGLMVFELSHVINRSLWNGIRKGISRVEK
jgi:uncharacterized lipoprotein YddW (UPF0748 family)